MKKKKKPYWVVDNQGFISLYALMFLQITIAFVTMICVRCDTLIQKNQASDFVEVFLINHVKATFEDGQPDSEELSWQDYEITITYDDYLADIEYVDADGEETRLQIEYDDICMCVMKIAYPD